MACKQEVSQGSEWRVNVPEGSTVKFEAVGRPWLGSLHCLASAMESKLSRSMKRAWKMSADDPRKVIHCIKVGLALTLASIFYYTRPLYDGVGGTAMWAIMTVVVVFEFTVGGSLYKALNRAIATFSAGALAVGIHHLASKSGETAELIILAASVFLLFIGYAASSASAATFSRFLPTVKSRFDYGITIFILTFSLVAISGYRVDKLLTLAQWRFSTVMIGISICLIVCILICPVWAGEELHSLIILNMERLANSLEECIAEYFQEGEIANGKTTSCQNSKGYKSVLNSKASEDSLANLARWEPAHGRFGFRHPWGQYQKVGAAMRYCAYCIEALNGCINLEVEAPDSMKKHLNDVCIRVSIGSSKLLEDLSHSIKLMKKSSNIDYLLGEMNSAVKELLNALTSLSQEEYMPLTEALPLITVASLLIEISIRIEGVVEAVKDLAGLASFAPVDDEKPKKSEYGIESISSLRSQVQETENTLEQG